MPISPQIRFHATCDQDFRKFRNFIGYEPLPFSRL
ncbi:hypothetical protein T11_5045 [Trichinella zimbabwensis]|uniref:Uncharacterized protein n=1 Tax=Trichinella zimbabwensis TaxID=268475 RepID=A0A0V1GLL8_9BILA|nr:hypothetical protein T11_5045 [Trichinella zimbabwensis]